MDHFAVTERVRASSLPATQRAVLLEVSFRGSGSDGKCFEGQAGIAAATGLSPRTVRRDLALLLKAGVLAYLGISEYGTDTYRIEPAAIPIREVSGTTCQRHHVPGASGTTCQIQRHQVPPIHKKIHKLIHKRERHLFLHPREPPSSHPGTGFLSSSSESRLPP